MPIDIIIVAFILLTVVVILFESSISFLPTVCPTMVMAVFEIAIAGRYASDSTLKTTANAASAFDPKKLTNAFRKSIEMADAIWFKDDGIPTFIISFKTLFFITNFIGSIICFSFTNINVTPTITLNVLAIRVATAAPSTPRFGNEPIPKMNNGSKAMFVIAAIIIIIIGVFMSPCARNMELIVMLMVMNTRAIEYTFKNSHPRFNTLGSELIIPSIGFPKKYVNRVDAIPVNIATHIDVNRVSRMISNLFFPRALDIRDVHATPMPFPRARAKNIIGNDNETPARASAESFPTNMVSIMLNDVCMSIAIIVGHDMAITDFVTDFGFMFILEFIAF